MAETITRQQAIDELLEYKNNIEHLIGKSYTIMDEIKYQEMELEELQFQYNDKFETDYIITEN